ncbi:TPA: hypothetical protein DCZ39_01170 [Patescibacteria group bacterium]|nr:hypothetical protein [Candidatus Gracilibacteria bacterium]
MLLVISNEMRNLLFYIRFLSVKFRIEMTNKKRNVESEKKREVKNQKKIYFVIYCGNGMI